MIPIIKYLDGGTKEAWEHKFNARHGFLQIKIWKDLPFMKAILAQEKKEFWFRKRWGAYLSCPMVGLAVTLGIAVNPMNFVLLIVALAIFIHGPSLPFIARRMELIGHSEEIRVAVQEMGANYDSYKEKEINSLMTYSQFKGWDRPRIESALTKETNKWKK